MVVATVTIMDMTAAGATDTGVVTTTDSAGDMEAVTAPTAVGIRTTVDTVEAMAVGTAMLAADTRAAEAMADGKKGKEKLFVSG